LTVVVYCLFNGRGSVVGWTIPVHPTAQDMSAPQHTGDLILP